MSKAKYYLPLTFSLLIFSSHVLALGNENNSEIDTIEVFTPGFRSIQLDGVIMIFSSAGISGSVDYDLFAITKKTSVGIRTGIEYYAILGFESVEGPFTDYNILARSTTGGKHFRWDIYAGLTYHTSSDKKEDSSKISPKYGMEFKYMFVPKFLGFLIKASVTQDKCLAGIGAVISFQF